MNEKSLQEERRRRLAGLLRSKGQGPRFHPPSFSQQRLWFLDQLEEARPRTIHQLLVLEGPVDVGALERSWNRLVRRHEALRTVFLSKEGEPLQAVLPPKPVELPVVDVSLSPEGDKEALLARALARSFDLRRGPLLRLLLLRLGTDHHLLVADCHHIVCDAWSIGVLNRDLEALYREEVAGIPTQLPELTADYGAFSRWQRQRLRSEALERLVSFWRERLAGLPPVLDLPADHPRPMESSGRGALLPFVWSPALRRAVDEAARRSGTTPFIFLVTAFQVLLTRFSGRRDLAVGVPVAGRSRPELEDLVGFFINSVVLRTRIGGDPTFEDLRKQVARETMEAFDHGELPFDRLVEELRPPRDLAAAPVYQVSFQVQTAPAPPPRLEALNVTRLQRDSGSADLDLALYLEPMEAEGSGAGGYQGFAQLSLDLFDPATVGRLLRAFETLVRGATESPSSTVFQLPLLSRAEEQQILQRGLDPSAPDTRQGLLAPIWRQVLDRPDSTALVVGERVLSYAQLWDAAGRLAAALRARGAGPEVVVAVHLERTAEQVIALLGVLAAGAVYLPLDGTYPSKRLAAMVERGGASLLLGAEVEGVDLPCLTVTDAIGGSASKTELAEEVPASAACLLFTSGSTGQPKAVCLSREGLTAHCAGVAATYGLSAEDRVLQFASVGFDTALEQTLPTLRAGGTLVLRGHEVWTAKELHDRICRHGVTVANLPAAYWHQVVEEWQEDQVELSRSPLRLVISGGEQVSPQGVRTWLSLAEGSQAKLLNAYGPTETTVTATTALLTEVRDTGRLPVGLPLAGRLAVVVDSRGRLIPRDVPGELLLGGAGVARGYWGDPRKTAAQFLPDPFSGQRGGRLYGTGDLARWRPDGQGLEILGRKDRQLKLRGNRIEPGEIEAVLEGLEDVRQAVVTVRPDPQGSPALVGYCVLREASSASVEELLSHARELLPAALVPTFLILLPALPLTPNGKVDLKALPAPQARIADSPGSRLNTPLPSNPAATSLAEAWRQLLGGGPVTAESDFFLEGGHSLLATRLVARVNRQLGTALTVRTVFEAPRFGDLLQRLDGAPAGEQDGDGPKPLPRDGESRPLSTSQERLWFLDRLNPGSSLYNVAGQLRLEGPLDGRALTSTLNLVSQRHETLRTVFEERAGEPVLVVQPPRDRPLPLVDLSGLPEEPGEREGRRLSESLALEPFDLSRGPLTRWVLVRLAPSSHKLVLVLHHIASDGWSQGVLFEEISRAYGAETAGESGGESLPELPIQYSDYAHWQRHRLSGERLDGLLAFWRRKLTPSPPVLALPADRPRPPVQSFRGRTCPLPLNRELADAVRRLARESGSSVFMVLQAGLLAYLYRLTRERDLALGTPVANRQRPELENLIGFFVNTLVLRTGVSGEESFSDLLKRARDTTLEASLHQELPFERLVAELGDQRDLGQSPLFQVMLAHQDEGVGSLSMAGLEVTLEPLETATSKFDWTVYVRETPEGFEGVLEYSSDLFDGATAARYADGLARVLAETSAAPSTPIEEVPLLSPAQAWQLKVEWGGEERLYGAERGLHELVEDQVDRAPDAVAVALAESGEELTYRELDERANQVAHMLRREQVQGEDLVAIVMERSLELMVALLGILKANAAYVPLDPDSPPARREEMLKDTGARLVLTQERFLETLPAGVPAVALDRHWPAIAGESRTRLALPCRPQGLAYVIYTSGSTGRPKGAMNRHRGIFNRLRWMQEAYRLTPADRVLQKTPYTFDVSVWELFWALQVGAQLVMAKPGGHGDPSYLVDAIRRCGITTLHFVPSVLQTFLEAPEVEKCDSLRRVICSGEALPRDLVERFHQRSGAELHNLYGPTEAAIDVTAWPCPPGEAGAVPIGRAIANTRTLVLDHRGRLCPVGVPGHLFLGGPNLGRGYHRRAALTAERFLPDPDPLRPGSRVYATGDLVRWRPDGAIDFLGRIDFQVKLRGLRIELGEIEAALTGRDDLREAVVVVRETKTRDQRLVAYLVAAGPEKPSEEALRSDLRKTLPEYMVPAAFVFLPALPLSRNGKVDRRALPEPAEAEEPGASAPARGLEREIAAIWQEVLGVGQVDLDRSFFDHGGHSLLLVRVQSLLRSRLDREVELVELFQFPTVGALAQHLQPETGRLPVLAASRPRRQAGGKSIAIVGMSGRFPGASGVEQLWRNLVGGVESISFFTEEELESSPMLAGDPNHPDFVRAGGVVEGADLFDAEFFGLTPREAEVLDPQQRLFLECAWEALEKAGHDPAQGGRRVGVYAGVGMNSYLFTHLLANPEALENAGGYAATLANDKDFLPTRASFKLGLTGPAVAVQTACSTSLVAIHMACRALRAGECDMALAGGVTIRLPQRSGYLYQPSMILSPDGHCRPFAAGAAGTVPGNGVGVVALKDLDRARADGDRIVAVIRGSAINNDGSAKVGFTAPGVSGQTEVIAEALEDAGVPAETISYVETHGTGTELGDPIEVSALTQAFRTSTDRRGFCALGSIKSNLGHLDAAAGVAGLIKAALALENRYLPPTLNAEETNPAIDFENGPFVLQQDGSLWQSDGPLRAGVSSFGIGGTNAHVVLEQAPPREASGPARALQLVVLSAGSPQALEEATAGLADALDGPEAPVLADAAWTLQTGRRRFPHRRFVVASSGQEAAELLRSGGREVRTLKDSRSGRPVAFLFSGQGAQYPGMGRELYVEEEVFRKAVDRCAEGFRPLLGFDLRECLLADPEDEEAARRLRQTAFTQPALFTIGVALAELWQSWGLRPTAFLGHSIGELTAAAMAGVFDDEAAFEIVATRGRLMQEMPTGVMLSVPASAEALEPLLDPSLSLAAVNGPQACVVSGTDSAIRDFEKALADRGIDSKRLRTSHAFHSEMMDGALEPFQRAIARHELRSPRIPFISNVTGTWIRAEEAKSPGYWASQLRGTVLFAAGAETLLENEDLLLLEAGPGAVLSKLTRRLRPEGVTAVSSLPGPRRSKPELTTLLGAVGQLWLAGADLHWRGFHGEQRRLKVDLPTYPFQRRRHLVEPSPEGSFGMLRTPAGLPLDEWFSVPSWRLSPPSVDEQLEEEGQSCPLTWVLFLDSLGVGGELLELLRRRGDRVVTVSAGEGFSRLAEGTFLVDPANPVDYRSLLRSLEEPPDRVVHLWNLEPMAEKDPLEEGRRLSLDSLVGLGQALVLETDGREIELTVVSSGVHRMDERDTLEPAKALLLGPCRVLQQEHPEIACRSVDIQVPKQGSGSTIAHRLLEEMSRPADGVVVAYRGGRRWVEVVETVSLTSPEGPIQGLRPDGTYLITGGLGSVGLVLAETLAREVPGVRLVLLGRSAFPEQSQWEDLLRADDPAGELLLSKIRRLKYLEELGAEFLLIRADVSERSEMARALLVAEKAFGAVDGVIHAAGVVGQGMAVALEKLTKEDLDRQLLAKVQGLRVLEDLLRERPVDFLLVTSSTASLLGGLGFTAYAAASAAVDAYVQSAAEAGRPWISVGWDGWHLDDQGERPRVPSLTAETGAEAFRRILDLPLSAAFSRLFVSPRRLPEEMSRWLMVENLRREAAGPADREGGQERPELSSAFSAPATETEQEIAAIWQDLLGIRGIGTEDDFFELGGHSLLATQLLTRIRDSLGVDLSLDQVFELPTVGELAAAVAERSGTSSAEDAMTPIQPVHRDRPLRLSFAQERMWLLYRFDPKGIAYNLPAAIRLRGDLQVDALRRTYDALVQRHEILRTRFLEYEGRPAQEVLEGRSYELPLVDLSDLAPVDRQRTLRALAGEQGRRPFDLSVGEVFRNALLRFEPEDHVFISACHHIVTDGWSGALSVAEIARLYPAFAEGRPISLDPLPFQYADFAEWQRDWLSGDVLDRLLTAWKELLEDRPPLLDMPTDRPRSGAGREAGRTSFSLRGAAFSQLKRLAQGSDTSLFMVSMAALMTLLHRYTGDTDILVGTASASRHVSGTENLLGVFLNTLVVRAKVGESPSAGEFLGRVRRASIAAYSHQDLPFDKLVEALQPERDPSGQTLFRVLMAFNHEPPPTPHLEGLDLDVLDLGPREDEAMFDLSMGLTDEGDGLSGSVQFNAALFDSTTVDRWLGNLVTLMKAFAAEPEATLSEIPLLGPGERHQVEVEWPAAMSPEAVEEQLAALAEVWGSSLPLGDLSAVAWPRLALLGRHGERVPMGSWGRLSAPGLPEPRNSGGIQGRFEAQGKLVLRDEREGVGRSPSARRERAARQRWHQIEGRRSKLSTRKRELLARRLAGLPVAAARGPKKADSSSSSTALVPIQAGGDRPPLFCVHAIAGDVTSYLDLADALGEDQPFFGLQAPGLSEERVELQSVEEMAGHYVTAIRQARPDGPYVLAGWSMGAVVGFEMAQQLQRSGSEILQLLMLEPSVPGLGHSSAAEAGIRSLVQDLESRLGRRLPPGWRELAGPGHDRQARYLLGLAQQAQLSEAGMSLEDWPRILRVYENNVEALQKYRPVPYSGPAVLVSVEHGPERSPEEDPRSFWRNLVEPGLGLFHVTGSHTSMLRRPHVSELARLLRESLDGSLTRA